MYSFLVDDNSEHKKAKRVNRNVLVAISHNEYKDVLLNNKCLRHSVVRLELKVKITEQELMKLTEFHCLVLMTKYIFKTMIRWIISWS